MQPSTASTTQADDANMADVWYNIGQVAIGVGDLGVQERKKHLLSIP